MWQRCCSMGAEVLHNSCFMLHDSHIASLLKGHNSGFSNIEVPEAQVGCLKGVGFESRMIQSRYGWIEGNGYLKCI
jgi:hypothetical protein